MFKTYQELKDIVQCLTPEELKTARHFVVSQSKKVNVKSSTAVKLITMVRENPDLSKNDARKKLTRNKSLAAFYNLVTDTHEKLLELLVVNRNIHSEHNTLSEWFRAEIDTGKRLSAAKTLHGRGQRETAITLYDEIIEKGTKFEIYNHVLEAMYNKQHLTGLTQGYEEFQEINKQILFVENCRSAVYKAKYWYYRYFSQEVDFKGLKNEKVGVLTEAIAELQQDYKITKSANVGYCLYLLMMEYYTLQGEYENSFKTGEELLKLTLESPAIYMGRRIGSVYSDLAYNGLDIHFFDKAIKYAQIAQTYFTEQDINYSLALVTEFRARYYKGQLSEARKLSNRLVELTGGERSTTFQHNKHLYFQACMLFNQGYYKKCRETLRTIDELDNDKEGWDLGIRFLYIMCGIELIKPGSPTETQIHSLKRHINRIKDSYPVRQRDVIIGKILRKLELNSFDFKKTWKDSQDNIKLLSSDKKDYRWEVKSPEMIVFHKWLEAKANGKTYSFEFPGKLEKVL